MSYKTERYYPVIIAVIVTAIFYFNVTRISNLEKLIGDLVGASLIVSATLLGFFLTITTILSTITTRRMRFVKDSGAYTLLIKYQNFAIWLNVACVSFSVLYPFIISFVTGICIITWIYTSTIFLVLWSWISSIRFMHLFLKVIRDPE